MKAKLNFKSESPTIRAQQIHQTKRSHKKLYEPHSSLAGLQCKGERFEYIVDWQVNDKQRKQPFEKR